MDYALKLLKQNIQKNRIDGLINVQWRFINRQECLSEKSIEGKQFFQKYEQQVKDKKDTIGKLDKEIMEKENHLYSSIREGTISGQSKKVMHELLHQLKKSRDVEMGILDSISKNWETAIRKYEKKGPPQKRGRKPKSSVVFKTAKQLKTQDKSEDMEVETINIDETEITSTSKKDKVQEEENEVPEEVIDNEEGNDISDKKFFSPITDNDIGRPIVVAERDNIVAHGQLTSVDNLTCKVIIKVIENECEVLPPDCTIGQEVVLIKKYVKTVISTTVELHGLPTETSLCVMNVSQFNCSSSGPEGSSACMGIALKFADQFLQHKVSFQIPNISDIFASFGTVIQTIVEKWKTDSLPPLTFVEAIKLLELNLVSGREEWWPKMHAVSQKKFSLSIL